MRKGRPVVNRPPSLRSIDYVVLAAAMGAVVSGGLGGSENSRSGGGENQGGGTVMALLGWSICGL